MRLLRGGLLIFVSVAAMAVTTGAVTTGTFSPPEPPTPALNQYVAFLNQSVDDVMARFQRLQAYQTDVKRYQQTPGFRSPGFRLRLPSSGPLERYYYEQALAGKGLTSVENQRLAAGAQVLWRVLNQLDETGKALETHVRLQEYERDTLHRSAVLVGTMQALCAQFSQEKDAFYAQLQRVYHGYQPQLPTAADAYRTTEAEMAQALLSQQQLLRALPYVLDETRQAGWPRHLVQQSLLADEKRLADFGKAQAKLQYPASDVVAGFKAALQAIQAVKRRAIDDYTFAAQQSARHGNEVYLALLQHVNQDLLANHQAFVNYSRPAHALLLFPKISPVFTVVPPVSETSARPRTSPSPFRDQPPPPFSVKPAAAPASRETFLTLNAYVEFINESLRQMHQLQGVLRNYQSSAESYRDPARARQRGVLTYAHEGYKVPLAEYHLLVQASQSLPAAYRASLTAQLDVLLGMLTEMDDLSIELIAYTTATDYLTDHLRQSDAMLDRYALLFDTFDQKKERLYRDVRRIHESYPVVAPISSWNQAGAALRKTLDDDQDVLFGVRDFLKGETAQLPPTQVVETGARNLQRDEYQHLKGLPRLGRSNGQCPYSPYEDLAENSLRLTQMLPKLTRAEPPSGRHPYEAFYYFFNNELVYQYNKFTELAKTNLLKAVNQPDLFRFRRLTPSGVYPAAQNEPAAPLARAVAPKPDENRAEPIVPTSPTDQAATERRTLQRDTVYVERLRVDTVYVDRTAAREVSPTLAGFAPNNMVLLLDVSASMEAPQKLPLLKRSVKSLLALLRPEDQLSIVVYSGKARVALKPTPGDQTDAIARVIDGLRSAGDTDGDGGIRLAYKVANKQYIRAGNNRIVLATDGEFPVSDNVLQLIRENAQQDVYLTVFTFGKNPLRGQSLRKLSELGHGSYTHVTAANANLQLILEAQAKQQPLK